MVAFARSYHKVDFSACRVRVSPTNRLHGEWLPRPRDTEFLKQTICTKRRVTTLVKHRARSHVSVTVLNLHSYNGKGHALAVKCAHRSC